MSGLRVRVFPRITEQDFVCQSYHMLVIALPVGWNNHVSAGGERAEGYSSDHVAVSASASKEHWFMIEDRTDGCMVRQREDM